MGGSGTGRSDWSWFEALINNGPCRTRLHLKNITVLIYSVNIVAVNIVAVKKFSNRALVFVVSNAQNKISKPAVCLLCTARLSGENWCMKVYAEYACKPRFTFIGAWHSNIKTADTGEPRMVKSKTLGQQSMIWSNECGCEVKRQQLNTMGRVVSMTGIWVVHNKGNSFWEFT